jgi:hypothetical protein
MAEATKISIRFLRAIEEDRVEILPGGIFPKAFVRQYARYLGLDSDRLVAEFVYAHGGEPAPVRGPRSEVRVDQGWPRGVVVAAVAIGVLGLVGWRIWGPGRRAAREQTAAAATTPPSTFAEDRVFPPPSSTVVAGPAAAGALAVGVTAQRASWVEARVDGTTMLSRVLGQGETQRFDARREVVLSLGNAGGVSVTVNGKPLPPLGHEGDVRKNIVVDAKTLPALLAGATVPGTGALASPAVSPRPRPTSPPASPAPSELPVMPAPTTRPLAPLAAPSPLPES